MFRFHSPRHFARPALWLVAPFVFVWIFVLGSSAVQAATIDVDGSVCTLPDAITAANMDTIAGGCTAGNGTDTLLLGGLTHSLATGLYYVGGWNATPVITSTILISGGVGGAVVERTGEAHYRLFSVGYTGHLTLQSVTVRYGFSDVHVGPSGELYGGKGGAIYNYGALTLIGSDIVSNTATIGGGIYNSNQSTATLIDSDFISNTATGGGGIYSYYESTVTLTNCNFLGNTAYSGGGISSEVDSTVTIKDSKFVSNTAATDGGGIYTWGSFTFYLIRSVFIGNQASNGGGTYSRYGPISIIESDYIANTATSNGGGIYSDSYSTIALTDTRFISNTATSSGGGIYSANYNTIALTDTRFIANAASDGGGIYSRSSSVTVTSTDFISNTATNGGGIYSYYGSVTVTSTDFVSNTAASKGGGIYQGSQTLILTNNDFLANAAEESGGGIYNDSYSTAIVTNGDFLGNRAANGGAIFNFDSTTTISDTRIVSNTAAINGGGIANVYRVPLYPSSVHLSSDMPATHHDPNSYSVEDANTVILINSEIRANVAISSGGGLYQEGDMPEISNISATTTIVSSHLFDNVAGETGGAVAQLAGSTRIDQSCIVSNTDISVNHIGGAVIDAANNWWGTADGPSGAGPGMGDSVSSNVTFAPVLGAAPANCPTLAVPALAVAKSANTAQAEVGETITYTYRITNTGNITFATISARDDRLGVVSGLAGELAPNATRSATLTYTVQLGDLPGPLVNTVIVTGTEPLNPATVASATVSVAVSEPVVPKKDCYLPYVQNEVAKP